MGPCMQHVQQKEPMTRLADIGTIQAEYTLAIPGWRRWMYSMVLTHAMHAACPRGAGWLPP